MANEFDNLEEDFPQEINNVDITPKKADSMVSAGSAGTVYDYNTAPEGIKAPPRIDLNGKTVIIKKADIVLPPMDKPWVKTRGGDKEYKYCTFVLHYDFEGQQEFLSGVRTFKREEKDPNGYNKYSHPTLTRDRKNQSSKLLGLYADFKKKDINEVSLKEFMMFLNSKPKVVLESVTVENPTTGEKIKKNFVQKFVQ